jgi:hypothetical protein
MLISGNQLEKINCMHAWILQLQNDKISRVSKQQGGSYFDFRRQGSIKQKNFSLKILCEEPVLDWNRPALPSSSDHGVCTVTDGYPYMKDYYDRA